MRRVVFFCLVALAAACTHVPQPPPESPAVLTEPADAPVTRVSYTCDNGIKLDVTFDESGNARVRAGTMAEMELPGVIAASGNKFSNGRYTLWTKGMDEAMWIVGRMAPTQCTAPAQ